MRDLAYLHLVEARLSRPGLQRLTGIGVMSLIYPKWQAGRCI
jgi:hypothetical protein